MSEPEKINVGDQVSSLSNVTSFDHLNGQLITSISGVRVFDVGQGDCVGLTDKSGNPFLYIDYGGLLNHPDKKDRKNVINRLPVSASTTIVLTHWDWDHYNSAKYNEEAKNAQWLVPRQMVGPMALKFANGLMNVKCWPDALGQNAHRFSVGCDFEISIEKCAPSPTIPGQKEDRNLTGLAVRVIKKDSDNNDETYVLLPGDAPYHKIPSISSGTGTAGICIGMLAYHHGSKAHWIQATDQALPSRYIQSQAIVYSYGEDNSYGHANKEKYKQSDWDKVGIATSSLRNQCGYYEIQF